MEKPALPVEVRHALAAWVRAKQSLERVMLREDFQSFVRPMYLIAVLSESYMLLTIPANNRLYERARNFRPNLRAAIVKHNYDLAGIVRYPSDEELYVLRNHPSFAPFVELIRRKRIEKLEARREAEDARDSSDLRKYLRRQDSESLALISQLSPERVIHSERLAPLANVILAERGWEDARDAEARP